VSDHLVVRLEAWPVETAPVAVNRLEAVLASLPGATEHGQVRVPHDPPLTSDRRPYAWVLLPGDGSYCDHE